MEVAGGGHLSRLRMESARSLPLYRAQFGTLAVNAGLSCPLNGRIVSGLTLIKESSHGVGYSREEIRQRRRERPLWLQTQAIKPFVSLPFHPEGGWEFFAV